ncbi:MAG: DUF1732 domain-containing protein [Planctomycetota bacterium]|jgi:uncharacterized protein (TIGR00255 family)|nr:DUF1732 domain-containing protein [Planctomycetota bacterium]
MTETAGVIDSMTGFGAAAADGGGLSARVEVKSVNNRGLKISLRSRPSLGAFEKNLRDLAGGLLVRGSVDIYVFFERQAAGGACPIRAGAAREAVAGLRRLAGELGLPDNLSARDLALIPGVFDNSAEEPADKAEWEVVEKAARLALEQALEMRRAEGGKLAGVLLALGRPLEEFVGQARLAAPQALVRARERLRLRLEELCPNGLSQADGQALEREICLIADKADIREELDRLASHIDQYRSAIARGGEVGKRLEFLAQEFLREINTTAAKINDVGIVQEAVKAKLTVEKIKEQSANLV